MTASVLKQDPNTKRFKRTLIYCDKGTQSERDLIFLLFHVNLEKVGPSNDCLPVGKSD